MTCIDARAGRSSPIFLLEHCLEQWTSTRSLEWGSAENVLRNQSIREGVVVGDTWRRGRDSNPRTACTYAAFRVRCIRPLCHLSIGVPKKGGRCFDAGKARLPRRSGAGGSNAAGRLSARLERARLLSKEGGDAQGQKSGLDVGSSPAKTSANATVCRTYGGQTRPRALGGPAGAQTWRFAPLWAFAISDGSGFSPERPLGRQ